jgi:ATP-dependent Clp protease ATP-binding subunit ClpA
VELARRAGRLGDPEEGLTAVTALRAHLDALEAQHVEGALRAGLSWREIGRLLGVTRQAAHKKYAAILEQQTGEDGKPETPMLVPTEEARRALRAARQEAGAMGHRFVGPEHLLLGLLRDDQGTASYALEAAGISFAAARREVRRLYGEQDEGDAGAQSDASASDAPISNRARTTLEAALEEAGRRGDASLGVEHLLAALLGDLQGGAVQTLLALGVTVDEVEHELSQAAGWSGDVEGRRVETSEEKGGSTS